MSNEWRGHTCIYGSTGSGKSTLAKHLIKGRKKVIRFDPQAEPGSVLSATREGILKGKAKVVAAYQTGFDITFRHTKDDHVACLNRLVPFLDAIQCNYHPELPCDDPRPLIFFVDEASKSMPNERQKAGQRRGQDLSERGRWAGIEMVVVTQRPARLDPDMRGACDTVYAFRLSEEDDQKAILKKIGRKHASLLTNLKRYEFIKWTPGGVWSGTTTKAGGISKLKAL